MTKGTVIKKYLPFTKTSSPAKDSISRANSYLCEPLNASRKEIRLIDVLPAEDQSSPIRCSARAASLIGSEIPEYETISYVWGDAKERAYLQINGESVSVPASSVKALRRVRRKTRNRTLWIDAICINQSDLSERSEHVTWMSAVYKHAQGNLIYLGDNDLSMVQGFYGISLICKEVDDETDGKRFLAGTCLGTNNARDVKYAEKGLQCSVSFDDLVKFYSLPWFSRVWVFQEAAYAPSNTCFLGPLQFDLSDALVAARWLEHKHQFVPYDIFDCRGRRNAFELWALIGTGRDTSGKPFRSTLRNLLEIARELGATEPRDRVYGMLGLGAWPEHMKPDYRKPVEEVYRDAIRCAIQENGDCGIWSLVSPQTDKDLRRKNSLSWTPLLARPYDVEEDPTNFLLPFAADKGRQASFASKKYHPDILAILGFPVCTIEKVSSTIDFRGKTVAGVQDLFSEAWSVTNVSGASRLARASVLIAGMNADFQTATREDLSELTEFSGFISTGNLPKLWEKIKSGEHENVSESEIKASRFDTAFRQACASRRVFRTMGGFLGIGPKVLRPNDFIAVVYGSSQPLAFRKDDTKVWLLGECYVYGIMYGEAVTKHLASGKPDSMFLIH